MKVRKEHNREPYIVKPVQRKLSDTGYKLAICDQRPAAVAQRERQRMVGGSARVTQLKKYQRLLKGTETSGVIQAQWRDYIPNFVRHSAAAVVGGLVGAGTYFYAPGGSMDRIRAAAGLGFGAFMGTEHFLAPPSPAYARGFSTNLRNRITFNREMDRSANIGRHFNAATNTMTVQDASLRDVAARLRQREMTQRGYVRSALNAAPGGGDIYDTTITNHAAKNTLWRQWTNAAAGAQTRAGLPVGGNFSERVGTSFGRMIATTPGFQLLQHVQNEAAALHVPINFIEEDAGTAFNLSVRAQYNPAGTQLTGLEIVIPAAPEYDDAQSFKRSNRRLPGGGHDVTQTGEHITAAPIDTDLFHEYVHAAHYLAIERRRQMGGGNFVNEIASYRSHLGGAQEVLPEQDTLAEAATIHRSPSLLNLRALMIGNAPGWPGPGPNPHLAAAADTTLIDGIATAANIPSENDYRLAVGLSPRQDHRALTLTGGNYQMGSYLAPINVV